MQNLHILAFVWKCFSSVITKRRQALLHYLIIQPTRDSSSLSLSLFLFISFSFCLLPPLPLLHTHPLSSNSLGGSQGSNWQASRETERKEMARERERGRERQWNLREERSWHQSTLFSLFAMFPIFAFFNPPTIPSTASLLPPSALLFSLWRSRQIKIQLTDVWLTLGHTIRSHKLFDHNSI